LGTSLIPTADLLLADLQSHKNRLTEDAGDEITLSQKGSTWYVYTGPRYNQNVDPLVFKWLDPILTQHPDYFKNYQTAEPPKEATAKVIWDLKNFEVIV